MSGMTHVRHNACQTARPTFFRFGLGPRVRPTRSFKAKVRGVIHSGTKSGSSLCVLFSPENDNAVGRRWREVYGEEERTSLGWTSGARKDLFRVGIEATEDFVKGGLRGLVTFYLRQGVYGRAYKALFSAGYGATHAFGVT